MTTRTVRTARPAALLAVVLTALLALAGCTPGPPNEVGEPVAIPDTAAGLQAQWILDTVNAPDTDGAPDEGDVGSHFSASFRDEVPPDQIVTILEQLRSVGPWTPTSAEGTETQLVMVIESPSSDPLQVQLSVDDEGLMQGLLFQPVPADREPATSWSELENLVDGLAADTTVTVTRVGDGERVFEAGDDTTKPLGSIFKLYVLGAVADAVADGALTWQTELVITDDVRSLPSGELQNEPSGTAVTVLDAATGMISISDNTATDLLIEAVGRDAVERALAAYGHTDPALNTPFLTTRELFQLGWGGGGTEAREAWAAADVGERRGILESLPGGILDIEAADVVDPVWQYDLDWFATPDDLVAVHEGLQRVASTEAGAPVRDILSANPGLDFGDDWAYVGFKGGSSVGVLAGSWWIENAAGDSFVIIVQAVSDDPADLVDAGSYLLLATDAAAILAAE